MLSGQCNTMRPAAGDCRRMNGQLSNRPADGAAIRVVIWPLQDRRPAVRHMTPAQCVNRADERARSYREDKL